ncbi:sugar kinase [Chelativorans intermedius]|uniref:Sugar kinase n=1 Tax=Chelativorans intermedius TaxID=515947 RepID=A0ABV6D3Y9_9HYPH|nr:sugar kinase [Chelativorans intermedius]MCT8997053.1 sugar kinase [Chelativorans intermedius]
MARGGVAAVGECMLELSGGDGSTWRMGYAGDTFNTLWTLRALVPQDLPTDYVTAFGDDPFSAGQKDFFARHGIGTAASPAIPGRRPGLYAITLQGAERSFTYWRGDSAARSLADDPAILEKSLEKRELIYFSGITLAILEAPARKTLIDALARARSAGSRIAFDPNYRSRLWPSAQTAREAVAAALSITDIALPTFPDEAELFGDETPKATAERLARAGIVEIAVKNGAEATHLRANGEEASIAATAVADPVDTTGAGDSFNGAYLAARLAGDTPRRAATRAHRVAAAVIRVHGALAPFSVLRDAFAGA